MRIAAVTSLPERKSGISAVRVANIPDIAVGSLLGAFMLNLWCSCKGSVKGEWTG
jgi:cation:H+ antiporter